VEGDKPKRKKFESCPIGYFHIDLAKARTVEGKLYLFVAIDQTSKFAVVELVERADMRAAATFLEALVGAVPYRIHTILTDNGIQFADLRSSLHRALTCILSLSYLSARGNPS
jgi:transposase-like protein